MKTDLVDRVLEFGDDFARGLDADGQRYWVENRRRSAVAVAQAGALLAERRPARVIDIGPSIVTLALENFFPEARIETMGRADHRYRLQGATIHHALDLNDAVEPARCPRPEPCDLILLLEVIEHLPTAPICALRYLHGCLRPGGHLIVSTPNAAWLRNRWRLLCGENPFEPIRENARNPGHFREYTRGEFAALLAQAGFEVVTVRLENLYTFGSASGRRFMWLADWLPPTFRHDMLFVARRAK